MSIRLLLTLCIVVVTIAISCKKKESCPTITVLATKQDANLNATNGKIIVTAPKGSAYTYSINGGTYQADTVFNNLAIGSYTISVKDAKNCTGTITISLVNPCAGVTTTVVATKVDAITTQTNGSITVTSPVGSGITYSVGSGAYQASTNFNNLGAGTYTVNAKTAAGCTGSTNVTIVGYGPQYYATKAIIQGYCGPCHLNGGNSGGTSFDTDAQIVAKWDRIKARAVDNLPSVMPQGGPLTTADKQKITTWVNGGHTTSN